MVGLFDKDNTSKGEPVPRRQVRILEPGKKEAAGTLPMEPEGRSAI